MKNYILCFICLHLFFYSIQTSFASTLYSATSGGVECEGQAKNDNSGQKWIPISNTTSLPSSGSIGCIKNGYYSGNWGPWVLEGSNYACPNSGYASNIQFSGSSYRIYCKILDNTPPSPSEISSSFIDNGYYKATVSNITITGVSQSGSPITFLETQFENKDNSNTYVVHSINAANLSYNEDFSKVDVDGRNDVTSNNYRPYSQKVTQVCDEAGNCAFNIKTFTYNVYANNISTAQSSIDNGGIDNGTAIADGSIKNVSIMLRDQFGNKILPVYTSTNTLLRNINFKVNFNNDVLLDQYTKTGGSSIFLKTDNDPTYSVATLGTNINISGIGSNLSNITGIYPLSVKAYTPTANGDSKAIGNFIINNVSASVSDIIGTTQIPTAPIAFKYKPPYTTRIMGSLKDDFFLQGSYQTGSIDIVGASSLGTNKVVSIEFGSGLLNQVSPKLNFFEAKNAINVGEGNSNKTLFVSNFSSNASYPIKTQIIFASGTLNDLTSAYFSTHLSYDLDGNHILYNSDIIGKDNYWGNMFGNTLTQKGLKVIGNTYSQAQQDILQDQQTNDLHILGNIEKASLKQDMRKKAFDIIKAAPVTNGGKQILDLDGNGVNTLIWNNADGITLQDKKILYFGNLGGENVTLNVGPTHKFTGRKTIIVSGGNLYIKSNIINNTSSDILGIIVMKDSNDTGGNIYIDPSVTRIDAIIYVDKSLISYDGSNELDGNTSQYTLKNQLYISGTVFSENTIGGSVKDSPLCPYYVSKNICTLIEAQKYDLNYLRRYMVKSDGSVLSGGINYVGIYNSSYLYYNFPLVISYNPLIQSSPPPLFEQ